MDCQESSLYRLLFHTFTLSARESDTAYRWVHIAAVRNDIEGGKHYIE